MSDEEEFRLRQEAWATLPLLARDLLATFPERDQRHVLLSVAGVSRDEIARHFDVDERTVRRAVKRFTDDMNEAA